MANLSINLLPQELTAEKKQRQKSAVVVQISVVALVLIIVVAGIVLTFRFAQSAQLNKTQTQISSVKQTINSPEYSQKEGLVVTLNSRLSTLNQITTQEYPAGYSFNMISKMLPASLSIVAYSTDLKGKAQLQLQSPDTATLSQFLDNLMDPGQNNQKITSASVDSISLNRLGQYDIAMTVNLAGGAKQ